MNGIRTRLCSAALALCVLSSFAGLASAREDSAVPQPIYASDDLDISSATGAPVALPEAALDSIKALHGGTFLVSFRPEHFDSAHSLVGLSNSREGQPNTYVNFFFSQNRLGLEVRQQSGGDYIARSATVSLTAEQTYTAALSADPDYGYKLYLDGVKVLDVPNSSLGALGYGFIDSLSGIDSGYIGLTDRNDVPSRPTANQYRFYGLVEHAAVYGQALSEDFLLDATNPAPAPLSPVFSAEGLTLTGAGQAIPGDVMEHLRTLTQGTVLVRFTPQDLTGVHSLLGLSNDSTGTPNSYFSLYVTGGKVGFELRRQSGEDIQKSSADADLTPGDEQYVAFTADPEYGYKVFLNGALVLDVPKTADYGFVSEIPGVNAGYVGLTRRINSNGTAANQYPFTGSVASIQVYGQVLPDQTLIDTTGVIDTTGRGPVRKLDLFKVADWNSPAFRIPSMLTTDDGVVIAVADIRFGNSNDSPNNIDTGIRTSSDGGVTWSEPRFVLNFLDYPNVPTSQLRDSASLIDVVMVKGDNNRVFLFVDVQPGGYGYQNAIASSGYIDVDGASRLGLRDDAGNSYYLGGDNVVYAMDATPTEYTVGSMFRLYRSGEEVSNIFYKASPIKVLPTCFICMTYSDDNGETWSDPQLMNDGLKTDDMKFYGTAPGVGIQMKHGDKAGRLVVPVYYTSINHTTEWNAVLYSDDNGLTWSRGESPNDGRIGGAKKMHESQIVEMPDGQLYMYSRNLGQASVAVSFDGGETWDDTIWSDNTIIMSRTTGCQLSIINFSQPINGKSAVILSNPAAYTRTNGSVRVGLIEEDGIYSGTGTNADGRTKYRIDWVSQKVVRPGEFAYSCLAELPNHNIALLYEENDKAFTLDHLVYAEYTLEYLMGSALSSTP